MAVQKSAKRPERRSRKLSGGWSEIKAAQRAAAEAQKHAAEAQLHANAAQKAATKAQRAAAQAQKLVSTVWGMMSPEEACRKFDAERPDLVRRMMTPPGWKHNASIAGCARVNHRRGRRSPAIP